MVAPGSVTVATGANCPSGTIVALAWVQPGAVVPGGFSESLLITTTGPAGSPTAGSFAVELLPLLNARVRRRTLLATVDGFAANQSWLVTPATLQSPDFTNR